LQGSRYNINLRARIVGEFVAGRRYRNILDIGCGDGSVSTPLLGRDSHLTLLDASSGMLAEARRGVPPELLDNVEFLNQDLGAANLPGGYDLILCIGVLAHISSPEEVVARIGSLLRPDGFVIAQVTDCRHFLSRALWCYSRMRGLLAPTRYPVSRISAEQLLSMFARTGLRPVVSYRYSSPMPGLRRLLSEPSFQRLTRYLHGHSTGNRNVRLGNEVLYGFTRSFD
jgi:SAM-dependent methyltransferase